MCQYEIVSKYQKLESQNMWIEINIRDSKQLQIKTYQQQNNGTWSASKFSMNHMNIQGCLKTYNFQICELKTIFGTPNGFKSKSFQLKWHRLRG